MASKSITSSGIRIPVELDTTRARKEAVKLGSDFASILKEVNAQFKDVGSGGTLIDMRKFTGAITQIQTHALKAKDAIDSIGQIKNIDKIIQSSSQSSEAFSKLSKVIGVTEKDLQSFYRQALNKQAVNDQIAALKGIESAVGGSKESVLAFAKAVGTSQEALAKYKLKSELFDLRDFDVATEKVKKFDAASQLSTKTTQELAVSIQKLSTDAKRVQEAGEFFKTANGDIQLFTRTMKEAGFTSKDIGATLKSNLDIAGTSLSNVRKSVDSLNPSLKLNSEEYLRVTSSVRKFVEENERMQYTKQVAALVNNNVEALKGLATQFNLTTEDVNRFEKAQRGVASLNLSNLGEAVEHVKRLGTSSNLSSSTITELGKSLQKLAIDSERIKDAGVYFKASSGNIEQFTKSLKEAGYSSSEINSLLEKNFKGVENSTQAAKNAIDAINPALKLNADEYELAATSIAKYIAETRRTEYVKEVAALVNNNATALRGLSGQFNLTTEDIKKFEQAQRGVSSIDYRNLENATNYIRSLDTSSKMSERTIKELALALQKVSIDSGKADAAKEFFKAANKDAVLFTKALKEAGYTSKEIGEALRKNLGNVSSSVQKARAEIDKLNPTLKNNKEEYAKLTEQVSKFIAQNSKIEYVKGVAKLVNNDVEMLKKLSAQFNITEKDIQEFVKAQEKASKGRGAMGIFSPTSLAAGMQSGLAAAGVSLGAYGIVEFGKSAIKTSMQLEAITTAFESIYGSSGKAAEKLRYIRKVSDDLGLSFVSTAQEAKKVFASAEAAGLGDQANKIFLAFSNAGAALKLTSDEMSSIYLAISQIMSKGKVSAEEMNQQLAERLPGATTLLAKSMNVTSIQLFKLFEQGKVTLDDFVGFAESLNDKYADAAKEASHTTQAELNRTTTAWQMFKDSIVDTGVVKDSLTGVSDALNGITNSINGLDPEQLENWKAIAAIMAKIGAGAFAGAAIGAPTGVGALPGAIIGGTAAAAEATASNYLERSKETTKVLEEQEVLFRRRIQLEEKIAEAAVAGNERVKQAYKDQVTEIESRLTSLPEKYKAAITSAVGDIKDRMLRSYGSVGLDYLYEYTGGPSELFSEQIKLLEELNAEFARTNDVEQYTAGLVKLQAGLRTVGGESSEVQDKVEELINFLGRYAGYTVKMKVQVDVTPADKIESEVNKFIAETSSIVKGTNLAKVAGLQNDIVSIEGLIKKNQDLLLKVSLAGNTDVSAGFISGQEEINKLEQRGLQLAEEKEKRQAALNELQEQGTKKQQAAQRATTKLQQEGMVLAANRIDLEGALGDKVTGVERKRQALDIRYKLQIAKIEEDKNVALTQVTSEKDKQLVIDNAASSLEVLRLNNALALRDINESNSRTVANAAEKQEKSYDILASKLKEAQANLASINETNLEGLNKSSRALELSNQKYKEQIDSIKQAAEEERIRYSKAPKAISLVNEKERVELLILEKKHTQDLISIEETRANTLRKDAKDRAQFYKELEKYTGKYSADLVDQNVLIDAQMERWRQIPGLRQEELQVLENILRLEASRTGESGFIRSTQKYLAESQNLGKNVEDVFNTMYKGIDTSTKDMWSDFILTGKSSLDGLKNVVKKFIAELSYELMIKPLQVKLIASLTGDLTGGAQGAAGAIAGGGGGGGLMGNGGLLSSFIPKNFFSDITGSITEGINSGMASLFPNTFASNATAFDNAAIGLLKGQLGGGHTGLTSTFLDAAGPAFGAGSAGSAVGGFVSPYINNMLGIENGKNSQIGSTVGGLGATGVMTGLAAANIWNPGGWVMAGISALASIFGGGVGGLFDKKPKRPAIWGGAELNLGDPKAFENYDFGKTFDPKGYGKDMFAVSESGNYALASRARNKASNETANQFNTMLKEVADAAVVKAGELQEALPESYATAFKEQLSKNPVSASWDVKGEDINEENFTKIIGEFKGKVEESFLKAFQGLDFSEYKNKINVDQSTIAGMDKFVQAIALTKQAIDATAQIKNPVSEIEQQANAAVKQLNEWAKAMEKFGVTTEYAKELSEDYRKALIESSINGISDAINPLNEYSQAINNANDTIDDRIAALKTLGATEEQLSQVEGMRAEAIKNATEALRTSFENEMRSREAQLSGYDPMVTAVQKMIDQEKELLTIRQQFGRESEEYTRTQSMQLRELTALHREAAQAMADTLASMVQGLSIRAATAYGKNDEAALMSMQNQHKKELEDARKQAIQNTNDALVQAKVDALNKAQGTQPGQEGGWTSAKFLDSLNTMGMTVKEWFDKYGKKEGFGDIGAGYDNTAIEDALKAVQAVEIANLKLAQAQAAADQAESIANAAKSAYDSILSSIQGLVGQLKRIVDEFKNAAEALLEARKKLWAGDANVNPETRLKSSQQDFDILYAKAMTGDSDAATELAGMGDSLLALYRNASSSSQEYMGYFTDVDQKMKDAQKLQEKLYTNAKTEYDILAKQYGLQETQSLTQEQILEKINAQKEELANANNVLIDANITAAAMRERMLAAQEQANAAMAAQSSAIAKAMEAAAAAAKAAQEALDKANNTQGSGSADFQSMILQSKAYQLNNQNYGGRNDWTPAKILQEFARRGISFEDWYRQYGKNEGLGIDISGGGGSSGGGSSGGGSSGGGSSGGGGSSSGGGGYVPPPYTPPPYTPPPQTGFAGSKYPSEYALISAKVDRENSRNYGGRSNWSYGEVRAAMMQAGSIEAWYRQYGRAEGFAKGGITPRNKPFLVGEQGPELIVAPHQLGVVNNRATNAMLESSQGDSASTIKLCNAMSSLLKEVSMIRGELGNLVRQMASTLSGVKSDTRSISDQVDEIINDGIDVRVIGTRSAS